MAYGTGILKSAVFDAMYDWIFKGIEPPYYIHYRFADTDEKRFKVRLSM